MAFPVVAPELAIMRGFRIVHGLMLWSCLFVHGKEEEALPPRDERKVDEPEIVKAAEVSHRSPCRCCRCCPTEVARKFEE